MIIIHCSNKIEWALKKYRQKVDKTGQISELRDRREYEKPSQKKRRVKNKAKYREKYGRSEF
jgi:ribosomal protein S21